jgi:hypothetical protein
VDLAECKTKLAYFRDEAEASKAAAALESVKLVPTGGGRPRIAA